MATQDSIQRGYSRGKDLRQIGLVVTDGPMNSLRSSYWTTIISSITLFLEKAGYQLVIFTPYPEDSLEDLFLRLSNNENCWGYIVSADRLEKSYLSPFIDHNIPFVLIGSIPGFDAYRVDIDNLKASYTLTRYMQDKGLERICYFSSPLDTHYSEDRLKGYQQAMEERGFQPRIIAINQFKDREIGEALDLMFLQWKNLDGLLISSGGEFLLQLIWILKSRGADLEQMGITVFDDYPFMNYVEPPLTALRQPIESMGEKAVELILNLHDQVNVDLKEHILETVIIPRGSCNEHLHR